MNIETTDDLLNQFADWIGVYGACKHCDETKTVDGEEVRVNECSEKSPLCCRVGFMIEMKERMLKAVENDNKLNQVGLNK